MVYSGRHYSVNSVILSQVCLCIASVEVKLRPVMVECAGWACSGVFVLGVGLNGSTLLLLRAVVVVVVVWVHVFVVRGVLQKTVV